MSAIPVLMYHSISDDGQKMSVSKHNFYKQAKIMLKLGFKSVNLKDIFNRGINYKKVELGNTFPKYILENLDKFKDWIV